jgi:hypothetical protein
MIDTNDRETLTIEDRTIVRTHIGSFVLLNIFIWIFSFYSNSLIVFLFILLNLVNLFLIFIRKGVYLISFKDDVLLIRFFHKFKVHEKVYKYECVSFSVEPRLVGRGNVEDVLCIYINNILEYRLHLSYRVFFSDVQLKTIEDNLEKVVPRRPKKKSRS